MKNSKLKQACTKATLGLFTLSTLLSAALPQLAFAQTLPPAQTTTSTYEYDANGNLTKRIDPRTLPTTQSYDSLNRLRQQTQPAPFVGSATPVINYGVDGRDQVTSVQDPRNLSTTYTITGLGDVTQQVSLDTGTTGMTFDPAGNLKTRLDARSKNVAYTYDSLNRITKVTYPTGTATVFEYDGGTVSPPASAKGKLSKMTDESGSTAYTYDALSRLSSKVQTVGTGTAAKVQTVTYTYGNAGTALGKINSMTYPSGNRINYSFDAAGRISTISLNPTNANGVGTNTTITTPLLNTIGYEPFGSVNGWTWGNAPASPAPTAANGGLVSKTYDLDGRLSSYPLGHAAQGGLTRSVTYDAASRIGQYTHVLTSTGATSALAQAYDQSFGYDDGDRLTSYSQGTTVHAYSYDLSGNRTQLNIGGTPYATAIAPTSNRLNSAQYNTGTSTGTRSFTYDAAGSPTALTSSANQALTLTYSDRGRLKSVAKTISGTVKTITYTYNGLEQRLKKSGPTDQVVTGANYYVYDEAGHLLGEYDANLKVVYETVYLGDTPVIVIKQSTSGTAPNTATATLTYNGYADHIDTPRVITRASDNKAVWRWDNSDPFGLFYPQENPSALAATPSITYTQPSFTYNPRFPGQVYDRETNLHYNLNRDYDAQTGRYIQSDPIGLSGGINTFSYSYSQPLVYFDPDGLKGGGAGGGGFTAPGNYWRQPQLPGMPPMAPGSQPMPRPPNYNPSSGYAEAIQNWGNYADGFGAITGGGDAGRHPSVPNAVEPLINPNRTGPFVPMAPQPNAPCIQICRPETPYSCSPEPRCRMWCGPRAEPSQ